MKTQRRHELQTNELADNLGRYLQQIQPYSKHILLGVVAVFVLGLVLMYMSNAQYRKRAEGWSSYYQAVANREVKELQDVARQYADSEAALWALLSAGDINLASGSAQLFSDREEAADLLDQAEKDLLEVERRGGQHPALVRRARFSLAQVYEAKADVKKARQYYELVAKSDPKSALGKEAKQRFDDLSSESIEEWYAWFAEQEPPQPTGDTGGLGPQMPNDLDLLPERPDISFPGSTIPSDLGLGPNTPQGDNKPVDESKLPDLTPPDSAPDDTTDKPDNATDKPDETPAKPPADEPKATPAPEPEAAPPEKAESPENNSDEDSATRPEPPAADNSNDSDPGSDKPTKPVPEDTDDQPPVSDETQPPPASEDSSDADADDPDENDAGDSSADDEAASDDSEAASDPSGDQPAS